MFDQLLTPNMLTEVLSKNFRIKVYASNATSIVEVSLVRIERNEKGHEVGEIVVLRDSAYLD